MCRAITRRACTASCNREVAALIVEPTREGRARRISVRWRRLCSGSRRCRSRSRASSRSGRRPGSAGSRTRGTGTSRPRAARLVASCAVAGVEVRAEPVRTPLPDVAGHVVAARGRSAGTRPTGTCAVVAVRAACSRSGKLPCHTFMRCSPPGSSSSPHGNSLPSRPPRAAYSHSASVGSRVAGPRAVRLRRRSR